MSMTTSVIICAYTEARWQQLLCAAESVRTQDVPVDEVLVVIDHNDELRDRAKLAMPWARVIPSSGSPGLSGARNTGIAASTGEVVLFLDDDAVAAPHWASHLLAPYHDPRVLGVGGAAHPVWEGSVPSWWPDEFGWVVGCSYRGQPVSTAPVRNLMGCNMSSSRRLWYSTGCPGRGHRGAIFWHVARPKVPRRRASPVLLVRLPPCRRKSTTHGACCRRESLATFDMAWLVI
jgi:glycosyltransferase involved in cell wall biosynthesis